MKCIEGEYGNICKEGKLFSSKTVVQNDTPDSRKYRFKLAHIKRLLRTYNRREYIQNHFYGMIEAEDGLSYRVYFNKLYDTEWPIVIGCKTYSKETVDRAIKAFL